MVARLQKNDFFSGAWGGVQILGAELQKMMILFLEPGGVGNQRVLEFKTPEPWGGRGVETSGTLLQNEVCECSQGACAQGAWGTPLFI